MADTTTIACALPLERADMLASGSTPPDASVIGWRFDHVCGLADNGTALFVGRTLVTTPDAFGIAVSRAASELEAQKAVAADPAVAERVLYSTHHPFRIVLHSLGHPQACRARREQT